jgi:glycosyltransferase involved in cell wall biosynthesis
MKVLHLNMQRSWGGGENQCLLLMRALAAHGVENHLLCRPGGRLEQRLRGEEAPVVIHHLPSSPWPLWTLRRRAARLARELAADVVHAHTGRDMRGLLGLGTGATGEPPAAVTVAHRRVVFPVSRAGLRGYQSLDGVIAVSAAIARRMEGQGLRGPRVRVIHSAVDTLESPTGRVPLAGQPAVLYLGSLLENKWLDGLLQALVLLRRTVPGAVLHLVGDGPAEPALRQLARTLLPGEAVQFHGYRTNPGDFINGATVLVLVSREEGLGTVALQAQFQGCPVVVGDRGGLPETLKPGQTGLLVPFGDPAALAAALERLALEPGLRERLAQAGPAWIRERFGLEVLGRATLDFYRELVAHPRR